MRSFASLTILGTLALTGIAYSQSLAEHAAAAAGATIGTAGGKPLSNALGKVFGDVDKTTATAAHPKAKATAPAKNEETKPVPDSEKVKPVGTSAGPEKASADGGASGGGSAAPAPRGSRARAAKARPPAAEAELAPIAPPPAAEPVAPPVPVVKEPSSADMSSLKVGASETEMIAALGAPESRVVIPDDDGHLRETCQYWAQGRPLGTVRLDNGQVVQVVVRNQ